MVLDCIVSVQNCSSLHLLPCYYAVIKPLSLRADVAAAPSIQTLFHVLGRRRDVLTSCKAHVVLEVWHVPPHSCCPEACEQLSDAAAAAAR